MGFQARLSRLTSKSYKYKLRLGTAASSAKTHLRHTGGVATKLDLAPAPQPALTPASLTVDDLADARHHVANVQGLADDTEDTSDEESAGKVNRQLRLQNRKEGYI